MRKLNDYIRELKHEIANNPEMQILDDVPLENDIDFSKKTEISVKQLKEMIFLLFIVILAVIIYVLFVK